MLEEMSKHELKTFSSETIPEILEDVGRGQAVAIMNGPVAALIGDGANSDFIEKYLKIKGEGRSGRPISAFFTWEDLSYKACAKQVCDPEEVPAWITQMVNFPKNFRLEYGPRFGTIAFLRFPISSHFKNTIPAQMRRMDEKDRTFFQNWDPTGTPLMKSLSRSMVKAGMWPAVTSLNTSGQSEICDTEKAHTFCEANDLQLYIPEVQSQGNPGDGKGSYVIITACDRRLYLTRAGNISVKVIELSIADLMENTEIDTTGYQPLKEGKYPHQIPPELFSHIPPRMKWIALMAFFQGKNPSVIIERIRRMHAENRHCIIPNE